jgi:hypothetical protein
MKKRILFSASLLCFCCTAVFAQKPAVAQPASNPVKPVVIVSTKELKRQLESNFKRKKYKNVLAIADTLLKRNKKDDNAFYKKLGSEIMLKMDKQAIADVKGWYKNKDTAATIIASIPGQFYFYEKNRSGVAYYKAGIATSPKNGIPYMFYAAELADLKKNDEALAYVNKGFALLNDRYKKGFANLNATVLYMTDHKTEAYSMLEGELLKGNNSADNIVTYFQFFSKDKKYQEGIDKAGMLIEKDSLANYFARRGMLYDESGNSEKACEDAMTLKNRFDEYDYWLKRFNCPQVMADVKPRMEHTYIYEVVFNDKTYDFRVSNPLVDMDNGVSFKYILTGDVKYSGTVNISKEAINTAHDQMNKFGRAKEELTDRTSVWISNEVFNELKTKGSSMINANEWAGQREFSVVSEPGSDDTFYTVQVDGEDKYIKCFKVEAKDGEQLWINDDPKNPLILKMKVDFSIELKQIL